MEQLNSAVCRHDFDLKVHFRASPEVDYPRFTEELVKSNRQVPGLRHAESGHSHAVLRALFGPLAVYKMDLKSIEDDHIIPQPNHSN